MEFWANPSKGGDAKLSGPSNLGGSQLHCKRKLVKVTAVFYSPGGDIISNQSNSLKHGRILDIWRAGTGKAL